MSRCGIGAHRGGISLLRDSRGFSLIELIVTGAVIGILTAIGVPVLVGVLGANTASSAAREVQTMVSRAKQLAIATRQSICVQPTPGGLRFLQGSCAGAAWIGPDAWRSTAPIPQRLTLESRRAEWT